MSTLLTRGSRALMFAVATLFTLSLLAPLAVFANTDFVSGDQAVINNPNGSGANLRNDYSVLDESTLIAELPQETVVTVVDGPYLAETGVWYWVSVDGSLEGWVEGSLLVKTESQPEAEVVPELPAEDAATDVVGLPWLEPIDSATVVDDNMELPEEGLAVRISATVDGEILGRVPVGSRLDVTEERIWEGEQSFVRVNFNGQGGYVNGTFVQLDSELLTEEPVADEPAVVPTEEAPIVTEEPIVEEPTVLPTEEAPAVTEEPVVVEPTVAPTEEAPVVTEAPVVEEELPTEAAPVVTEAPAVVDEVPTDVAPVVTEAPATAEAPATEVPAEEVPVTEVPTEEVPVADATVEAPVEDVAPTEEPVVTEETPIAEATAEVIATEVPTEEAPVETEEPTAEATAEPTLAPTEAAPAVTTAPAFDASSMIGSATVTGTNDGLRCRVAPDATSATLMVLAEGTKVMVFAEAANGYLGIDCGGVQGYADVNYLWSGGAGDGEIKNSNMSVVVTGTGNGLNCRTGAGTNYPVITVLRDGAALTTRGAATNGWTPVTCGGQAGFVSTTWVEVKAGGGASSGGGSSTTGGTATVVNTNGDSLYCRSGAGTSYSVITVLSPGQKVPVRGAAQGSWIPVTCGGAAGFASSQYLSVSAGSPAPSNPAPAPAPTTPGTATGTVTVANTGGVGLNCRSAANTGASVITVLRLGQSVSTRSGSTSGWTAVICGGKNGFVSSEYVTGGGSTPAPAPSTPKPTTPADPGSAVTGSATVTGTNGDGLNCRSAASSSASVITVLAPNQKVDVRGSASGGWLPIKCGGTNGWASSQYLTVGGTSSPAPAPSQPTPAPQPSGMQNGDHAQVSGAVNLRYSASLSSGVATVVPNGTVVLITGTASSGFYPVNWDGLSGFMSADYLVKTNAELSKRGGSAQPTDPAPAPVPGDSATGNALVNYAMNYLGYPYVWATSGPSSFDCSGFTYWVVKNVTGKNIGTGTWTQVSAGTSVSRSNLQAGDLVFFQNTYTAGLSHVGLYIGNNQFIHAQNEQTGVVVSSLDSTYYATRWYGAVRV